MCSISMRSFRALSGVSVGGMLLYYNIPTFGSMSEKRQRSPSPKKDSISKRVKEESSPPKSTDSKPEKKEYRQLPEIVFSIGDWDLLIQTTNDKETRLLYRNRKERINRVSSPYEEFVKSGYSLLDFRKILDDKGPDKAIDYVLTMIITYMLFVYAHQAGRIISIYDIIKFDALGYGHGGSLIDNEPGGKVSINPKSMPECFVQATPDNKISLIPQIHYIHNLLMHQKDSKKPLSRSKKNDMRDKISEEYSKCVPYYHKKTSQLEADITTLDGMLDDPKNDIKRTEDVLMWWFSDETDSTDWAQFKMDMDKKGVTEEEYRKMIVKGAIGFLKRTKRVYDKKENDCKEGAILSKTEALTYYPLGSDEDKRKMTKQGFYSCDSLMSNVLFEPKIYVDDPGLSEAIYTMLEEIRQMMSLNKSATNSNVFAFEKSHANDLLYTTGHTINESGFPIRFIRKLNNALGLKSNLSSLEYSNNLTSKDELSVESIFSHMYPFRIEYYYPICCNPFEKKGIEKHDSQTPGGRKKTRKQYARHTSKHRASVSQRNGPRRPFYRVR